MDIFYRDFKQLQALQGRYTGIQGLIKLFHAHSVSQTILRLVLKTKYLNQNQTPYPGAHVRFLPGARSLYDIQCRIGSSKA
jgi:hypothetical protein